MDNQEYNDFVIRENINHVVYGEELRSDQSFDKECIEKDKEYKYKYRYELKRPYETGNKLLCFIMFNPSTSSSEKTDLTTDRCLTIAKHWHYDGIALYNLYAIRTRCKELVERRIKTNDKQAIAEMIGPKNNEVLDRVIKSNLYDAIVCAWGQHDHSEDYDTRVLYILKNIDINKLRVLGITKDNQPKHPCGVSTKIKEDISASLAIQYFNENMKR